jgi:hypothetical protein
MKIIIASIALATAVLAAQAGVPVRDLGHLIAEQSLKLGDQSQPISTRANSPQQGEGDGTASGIGGITGGDTKQGTAGGIGGINGGDTFGNPNKMGQPL